LETGFVARQIFPAGQGSHEVPLNTSPLLSHFFGVAFREHCVALIAVNPAGQSEYSVDSIDRIISVDTTVPGTNLKFSFPAQSAKTLPQITGPVVVPSGSPTL
jgi:hypothetical protein